MKRILHFLTVITLCTALPSLASNKPSNYAPHSVRLRFVPVPHDTSNGGSADWTALAPLFNIKGVVAVMAHAGIGDTFPVKEEHKPKVFDVIVVSGNDSHLLLEVRSEEGSQRFDVKRGKAVETQVHGQKYSLGYSSTTVSSDEKQTTDKATIVVTRLP